MTQWILDNNAEMIDSMYAGTSGLTAGNWAIYPSRLLDGRLAAA